LRQSVCFLRSKSSNVAEQAKVPVRRTRRGERWEGWKTLTPAPAWFTPVDHEITDAGFFFAVVAGLAAASRLARFGLASLRPALDRGNAFEPAFQQFVAAIDDEPPARARASLLAAFALLSGRQAQVTDLKGDAVADLCRLVQVFEKSTLSAGCKYACVGANRALIVDTRYIVLTAGDMLVPGNVRLRARNGARAVRAVTTVASYGHYAARFGKFALSDYAPDATDVGEAAKTG
jgi:hypothetical protein